MKLGALNRWTFTLSLLATQCDQGTLVVGAAIENDPRFSAQTNPEAASPQAATPTSSNSASVIPATETDDAEPTDADDSSPPTTEEPLVDEVADEPAANDAPTAISAYPPGPYAEGNPVEGSIIENLQFRGMLNLSGAPTADLEPQNYTMQDLRETGASHALFLIAAAWCPSCQNAASDLSQGLAGDVARAREGGGLVVDLLTESLSAQPATDSELLAWALRFNMSVSLLTPADERVEQVFVTREYGYVIELETMAVIYNTEFQFFTTPTVAEVGMDGLLASLGL